MGPWYCLDWRYLLTYIISVFPSVVNFFLVILLICVWIYNVVDLSKDRDKCIPYECGFDPIGRARTPFRLRFFLLAVLFLVFDIEIVLLIILPLIITINNYLVIFFSALWFLLALLIGTLHELKEGAINWAE